MKESCPKVRRHHRFHSEPAEIEHRLICVNRGPIRFQDHDGLRYGIGDQSKLHFLLPEFFFNRLPVLDVCIRSNVTVRQIEAVWSENESRAAAPSFLRHSRSVSSSARGRLL